MIASGSSYYGVVRFWDKRQSKCLQVCTVNVSGKTPPRAQKSDALRVNAVVTSRCVCCAVLPAVRPPRDQPGVLPEVQQLPPVRSPGEHAADSGLQPEPLLNNARAPVCTSILKAAFLDNMFSRLLYLSQKIKLKVFSFFFFTLYWCFGI